jgi:hypothetical protein
LKLSIPHSAVCLLLAFASLTSVSCGCVWYVVPDLKRPTTPDFELQTGRSILQDDPVVTVVCRVTPAILGDHPGIQNEVAGQVSELLFEHDVSVTTPAYVQSWIEEHPDYGDVSEIGRHFEADYVIEIEIADFSLYEENSDELLRGRTEAYVSVVDMLPDGTGDVIYESEIDFAFPLRFHSETPCSQFELEFLTALSKTISWLFVPRDSGAQFHWAR